MKSAPTEENAATWFNALVDEKLAGVRHAEDGRLYATLKDGDRRRAGGLELRVRAPYNDDNPEPCAKRKEIKSMIGTKYTPALLASITVDYDAGGIRFGSVLGRDVEKVTVSSRPDGLRVSFVVDLWPEEGLDKRLVVLPAGGSVEIKSEVGVVSVIEETHTDVDKITSFFEDATSDEPWLVIVDPVEHE